MNLSGEEILSKIDSNHAGIIWVTESNMIQSKEYFHSIDYLFDGLLSQNHRANRETSEGDGSSYFLTKAFGHPFFLGHVKYNPENFKKDLKNIISLATPPNEQCDQVFIVSENPELAKKALHIAKKSFKGFSFH
jgi:hypothetical protein